MKMSKGHLGFVGKFEYFVRNGELFRAPSSRIVKVTGYRDGRWEAPAHMAQETFNLHKQLIEG